jgi:hypothetical protein
MLVFALLISVAATLLFSAPADPATGNVRYAASFSQSLLLSVKNSTADQFGGLEYSLGAFGLDLPSIGGSATRTLRYKTLAGLLAEDALLNLKVEVAGTDLQLLRVNEDMNEKLGEFLKHALDNIVGGRFGYNLRASTKPIDLGTARLYFETNVKNLSGRGRQVWSETTTIPLPVSGPELVSRVENLLGLGPLGVEADLTLEVTLELWST